MKWILSISLWNGEDPYPYKATHSKILSKNFLIIYPIIPFYCTFVFVSIKNIFRQKFHQFLVFSCTENNGYSIIQYMKNSAIFSRTIQENLRYEYDMLGPTDYVLVTNDKKIEFCWVLNVKLWVQEESYLWKKTECL